MHTSLKVQIRKVLLGFVLGGIVLFLCFGASGSSVSRAQEATTPKPEYSTWWMPWYNNVDLDTQLRFGNISNSLVAVDVFIEGIKRNLAPIALAPEGSTRVFYDDVNAGPVQIVSTGDIIAAERVIYTVNGVKTSFSEMMGLPASQLDTTYWMPWYNNVDLDTQLRIANPNADPVTVKVFFGGVLSDTITLLPGASIRRSYLGVNDGPVQIVGTGKIVAAERVIYTVNGVKTSFSEMMGLPASQLGTTYWMPWYDNNRNLDTQLRIGNVSNSPVTVDVFIGGVKMMDPAPIVLAPGKSTRVSYAGVNAGPVQIVSTGGNIIAAERVIYTVNGVKTSFSEMMGLPASQVVNKTYWMPWYNNVDLDTQLRIGNVSDQSATVHVFIAGDDKGPVTIPPGQSRQISYPGVNAGLVKIVKTGGDIVASERVIYNINGAPVSFSEMMGFPTNTK